MGSASSKDENQASVSSSSNRSDMNQNNNNKVEEAPPPMIPQESSSSTTSSSSTSEYKSRGGGGSGGGGGCPMKRSDGTYSYDWRAFFRSPHGATGSKPLTNTDDMTQDKNGSIVVVPNEAAPQKRDRGGGGGGGGGGCPVKEYNVYSQPIDSTNQMPKVANQLPAPEQTEELSTDRVTSSIAKGGAADEETKWTYPSPQMFYNALARKGKLGDTREEDMDSVVAIHNNMNEKTWARVLEWERVLDPQSPTPKLLKFMGRPADLSPKATLKHYLLGHPLPYDRHDWTILRSDGTTVRYVIDYYHDESRANETPDSAMPPLTDHRATPSLLVDVRPALDSPSLAWNRIITMPYARRVEKSTHLRDIYLPLAPTPEMKSQVQESLQVFAKIKDSASRQQNRQQQQQQQEEDLPHHTLSEDDARALAASFSQMLLDCREQATKMEASETDEEHQQASLDLTICMAKIVCPLQHKTLIKAVGTDDESQVEAALDRVSSCVVSNTVKRAVAKQKYPGLFANE